MTFELPKIYPITDESISGIPMDQQVERLIEGGSAFIQLREKYATSRTFYEGAAKSIAVARANGTRMIINDRVDIALALKADGAHLGQDDLPCEHARSILGKTAIIGISTHSPDQAKDALTLPVNYIAIGPIFSTSTKLDPDSIVGLDGLSRTRSLIGSFPLVAIGGITRFNVRSVLEAGADSAAIIGGLLSDSTSISENLRSILAEI